MNNFELRFVSVLALAIREGSGDRTVRYIEILFLGDFFEFQSISSFSVLTHVIPSHNIKYFIKQYHIH